MGSQAKNDAGESGVCSGGERKEGWQAWCGVDGLRPCQQGFHPASKQNKTQNSVHDLLPQMEPGHRDPAKLSKWQCSILGGGLVCSLI